MIRYIILLVTILNIQQAQAQAQNCQNTTAHKYLHGNDVKAGFLNGGDMFWNLNRSTYMVPYQTGQPVTKTIFAGALWLGGKDKNDNLMVAAQAYRSGGNNDYWAGPLDPISGAPVSNGCSDFDYIWQVKRWEIELHIQDFDNDGIINGTVPANISAWPGKGNPQFAAKMGFNLPNQDLAPFYDRNNNGFYEPMLGDYPVFEHGNAAAISEDMLWYVFNDNGNIHTQTNGTPLKAEVQVTAYSFYCADDSLVNRTIFIKNKIINRNNSTIYDFRAGVWHNIDLGNIVDDGIGCIPSTNTMYGYNLLQVDNVLSPYELVGYGVNPPVQAITILNQDMTSFIYHTNSSNGPQRMPQTSADYYSMLNGFWCDNQAITVGGDGYNPQSTDTTKFMFPDNPHYGFPQTWSMMTTTNASNYDMDILGAVSQDSLLPGEAFQLDLAYSYHRNNDSCNTCNVNLMYQQVPLIQQFYDNGYDLLACTRRPICTSNCVYPGDMNNNGIANDFDLLAYSVAKGQQATASARTIPTDDWWPYTVGAGSGYIDANGDGSIDTADWETNTGNWGDTHAAYTNVTEGFNTVGNDLFLKRVYSIFATDTIVRLDRNAHVNVYLGDSNNILPNLYGVTFRLDYDEDVFELLNSITWNAFLGGQAWIDGETRLIRKSGRVHYVHTRTDGTEITGGGNLGRLIFRVKPTAPINQAIMNSEICFSDFQAIDANGQNIPIGAECLTIEYRDPNFVSVIPIEQVQQHEAVLAPNPTNGDTKVLLELNQPQLVQIQLFDVVGHEVQNMQEYALEKGEHEILLNTQTLSNGIYFCRVQIGKTQQTLKLVKTM